VVGHAPTQRWPSLAGKGQPRLGWLAGYAGYRSRVGVVPGGNAFATPTTMANLNIFFLLLGDSSPSTDMFSIRASPGISVGELKEEVYAETKNGLKGIDPSDLHLWKVLSLRSFPISYNVLKFSDY
jgi:Crinkler effector protein N-terminal domain